MILVLCSCQISNKYSIHSANLIFLATAELTWLFTRLNIFEFYSTSILDLIRLYFCWGKLSNGWFLQLLCFVKLDSQLMIDTPPRCQKSRCSWRNNYLEAWISIDTRCQKIKLSVKKYYNLFLNFLNWKNREKVAKTRLLFDLEMTIALKENTIPWMAHSSFCFFFILQRAPTNTLLNGRLF